MPPSSPQPAGRDSLETEDGLTLYTQHWTPSVSPKAIVLLVHGYGEHCGRYNHVADTLARQGALVYAYDQRGHGHSQGPAAYVDQFEQYCDDLDDFYQYVQRQTPEVPVFLFGHSMGGLVTLLYVLNQQPALRGLLLSAPAISVNPDIAPFLRRMARVVGWLFPTLPTVRSPEGSISRDPSVVEDAEKDPLNYHGRIPARTGAELIRAGEEAQQRLAELHVPFLVIHGTADLLTPPSWSKRLYAEAQAIDKTLQLYEGLYHETFNEPEQDQVLEDLGSWLAQRIP